MTSPAAIPQRSVVECMGTVFSFDIRGAGVTADSLRAAIEWLHDMDRLFSTYRPESQICRIQRGELAPAAAAPEVRAVLDRCAELSTVTGGYFSAAYNGVLDPSGLVKGWAVEQVSGRLVRAGSTRHCVNGGGDVQCVGGSSPDAPWRVGIASPTKSGEIAAVVEGFDVAVATSGSAERGRHIVDPHTGARPDSVASITVVGRSLATADAYATAAVAMGERCYDWLATLAGYQALVLRRDGTRWATVGFDGAQSNAFSRPMRNSRSTSFSVSSSASS